RFELAGLGLGAQPGDAGAALEVRARFLRGAAHAGPDARPVVAVRALVGERLALQAELEVEPAVAVVEQTLRQGRTRAGARQALGRDREVELAPAERRAARAREERARGR